MRSRRRTAISSSPARPGTTVDEQQINLTRFHLLFLEERPFFLENRGLFTVGRPGEIDLFFSRRIGISGNTFIPIQGGARLTGREQGAAEPLERRWRERSRSGTSRPGR